MKLVSNPDYHLKVVRVGSQNVKLVSSPDHHLVLPLLLQPVQLDSLLLVLHTPLKTFAKNQTGLSLSDLQALAFLMQPLAYDEKPKELISHHCGRRSMWAGLSLPPIGRITPIKIKC